MCPSLPYSLTPQHKVSITKAHTAPEHLNTVTEALDTGPDQVLGIYNVAREYSMSAAAAAQIQYP